MSARVSVSDRKTLGILNGPVEAHSALAFKGSELRQKWTSALQPGAFSAETLCVLMSTPKGMRGIGLTVLDEKLAQRRDRPSSLAPAGFEGQAMQTLSLIKQLDNTQYSKHLQTPKPPPPRKPMIRNGETFQPKELPPSHRLAPQTR